MIDMKTVNGLQNNKYIGSLFHHKLHGVVKVLKTDEPEFDMLYVETVDGSEPFMKEYDTSKGGISGWLRTSKGYVDILDLESY